MECPDAPRAHLCVTVILSQRGLSGLPNTLCLSPKHAVFPSQTCYVSLTNTLYLCPKHATFTSQTRCVPLPNTLFPSQIHNICLSDTLRLCLLAHYSAYSSCYMRCVYPEFPVPL